MQQELVVLKQTTLCESVTSATRLSQSGVDEQLIMGRTGHHSIDGIRTYKWVSNKQKEDMFLTPQQTVTFYHNQRNSNWSKITHKTHAIPNSVTIPAQSGPPVINLTGCSSITINYTSNTCMNTNFVYIVRAYHTLLYTSYTRP